MSDHHHHRPSKRQRLDDDVTTPDHEDDSRCVMLGHKHELILPPDIAASIHPEDKAYIELIMNEVNSTIMSDTVILNGYSPEELGKIDPAASYKIWNYLQPPERNSDRTDFGYYQINVSIPLNRRVSYDSMNTILGVGMVGAQCRIKEMATMVSSPPLNGYQTVRIEFSFRFYSITKPMPVDKGHSETAVIYVNNHQNSLTSRNPIMPLRTQQIPMGTSPMLPPQSTTTSTGLWGMGSSVISSIFGKN